jgi:hypothetical protein
LRPPPSPRAHSSQVPHARLQGAAVGAGCGTHRRQLSSRQRAGGAAEPRYGRVRHAQEAALLEAARWRRRQTYTCMLAELPSGWASQPARTPSHARHNPTIMTTHMKNPLRGWGGALVGPLPWGALVGPLPWGALVGPLPWGALVGPLPRGALVGPLPRGAHAFFREPSPRPAAASLTPPLQATQPLYPQPQTQSTHVCTHVLTHACRNACMSPISLSWEHPPPVLQATA